MKRIFTLLFVMTGQLLLAQNLIQNNGFENGLTGWNSLWTRDPNSGKIEIIDSTSSSGTNSLRLEHWGKNDFSFQSSSKFFVTQGEYYVFSAEVKTQKIKNEAEISVALFDKDGNAIEWIYAPEQFDKQPGGFVQYTSRFIIPENVAYFNARVIGGDSCIFFIDNVSLVKENEFLDNGTYSIKSADCNIEMNSPYFRIKVVNSSGTEFNIEPLTDFVVMKDSAQIVSNKIMAKALFIPEGKSCEIIIEATANGLIMEMKADPKLKFSRDFQFPGYIKSKPGEFFIVPRAEGMILPVEEQYPFWSFQPRDWKSTCGFVGVTDLNKGYLIVSEKPFNASFGFFKPLKNDPYTVKLLNQNSKGELEYNRKAYFIFTESGGYVELARKYRQLAEELGYVLSFTEKRNLNDNIDKLQGAVNIQLLSDDFQKISFIDSLYYYGLRDAMISIGGNWFSSGSKTGLVDSMNVRGFLTGRYDIFTDVYPPNSMGFRNKGYPEDVIVSQDGSLLKGWNALLSDGTYFQGYYTCSKTHKDYARAEIADDLLKHKFTFRFIDVEMASGIRECYSDIHPATKMEDAENRYEALKMLKDDFNLVVGSEEAREYSFPVCDYGEGTMTISPANNAGYDWTTPTYDPGDDFINYSMNHAKRIPLRSLIYRDCHIATWYTGDGLPKTPDYWDKKEAFNILYGSMPLTIPNGITHWRENKIKIISSNIVTGTLLRLLEYRKMISHEFLTGSRDVQRTDFEGIGVIANFGTGDYSYSDGYDNYVIPQNGYVASCDKGIVFKIKKNSKILTAAVTDDLFFISPNEETTYRGITVSGALSLRKFEGGIKIAFIGSQTSFVLDAEQFPWNMKISGYTSINGKAVKIDTISPGKFRLRKSGTQKFYVLKVIFEPVGVDQTETDMPTKFALYQNYPNPFNPVTTIKYSIPVETRHASSPLVTLKVYDILGSEIATLINEEKPPGNYEIKFDADHSEQGRGMTSGVYFYRLQSGSFSETKKFVLMK